jgi:hypothetical protein|tara:strand:+ start:40 stop:318 length:279 start_codon:yes stop_codon:yes gene_type:complete
MILNKVNYKNLALYGIFKINNNYTVDADNLKVDATVSISYNLSNIQETITSIDEQITELRADEEITFEVKETLIEDYEEQLEILNFIKGKLS